jgi:aminoglycoside/choline kinase family phosphotransferase
LGIFARLDIRDGKPAYLDDIPLTLQYIDEVCSKYEELKPLGELLKR